MSEQPVETAVFDSGRFRSLLTTLTVTGVLVDMPAVQTDTAPVAVDWSFALLCCSALTASKTGRGQDAVLRVAQSCLQDPSTDDRYKDAAAILLERLGNRRAVELAATRDLIDAQGWTEAPAPVAMDVIRRRLELTIAPVVGESIFASTFQRDFWTAATSARWVSVSAPTSAGKSYIVKRWFEDQAMTAEAFDGVYLVPTRALIDEVSADLREDFGERVRVHTLPWDADIDGPQRQVFVLTQERLHLLQQRDAAFRPALVFIDEAQKFADGARGVLLQQVLDETVRRNPSGQVIFASPLTANPELLLEGAPQGAPTSALLTESTTVNQNLLWANQIRSHPRSWTLSVITGGREQPVGTFELTARPSPESKRLALVAVALSDGRSGNVVYVNGAADAEKTAQQIYDALGSEHDVSQAPDIQALRELVHKAVHPQYALGDVIERGVGFHYGNMPLLVKSEVERLFKAGTLKYLVCTSTLLEGVNLPCRNIFVRGPRKGRTRVMTAGDFWNLAGRAGRWGKEFQGNIVCIDTDVVRLWPTKPTTRQRQSLSRATDIAMQDPLTLRNFILSPTPVAAARAAPTLESVFSFLAARVAKGVRLTTLAGLDLGDDATALEELIRQSLTTVEVPADVLARHAGVSPLSMQGLLEYFRAAPSHATPLAAPESEDAAESLRDALATCGSHLGGNFGTVPGRHWQLAILVTRWMQGLPLSRLVNERVEYFRQSGRTESTSNVIRSVLDDIEQIARFEAPKYLACYLDVLRLHLQQRGTPLVAATDLPDISLMLELGVSRPTEVSLMSLGLSRTSAIALSEFIIDDVLTPAQCLEWIRARDLETIDLPMLVRREIELIARRARPGGDDAATAG